MCGIDLIEFLFLVVCSTHVLLCWVPPAISSHSHCSPHYLAGNTCAGPTSQSTDSSGCRASQSVQVSIAVNTFIALPKLFCSNWLKDCRNCFVSLLFVFDVIICCIPSLSTLSLYLPPTRLLMQPHCSSNDPSTPPLEVKETSGIGAVPSTELMQIAAGKCINFKHHFWFLYLSEQ